MEVNRISERNLGRDDRCISDHGREARFPFLDEEVVSFLSGLPVWLKVSFSKIVVKISCKKPSLQDALLDVHRKPTSKK